MLLLRAYAYLTSHVLRILSMKFKLVDHEHDHFVEASEPRLRGSRLFFSNPLGRLSTIIVCAIVQSDCKPGIVTWAAMDRPQHWHRRRIVERPYRVTVLATQRLKIRSTALNEMKRPPATINSQSQPV
jgi:hypothetical protein